MSSLLKQLEACHASPAQTDDRMSKAARRHLANGSKFCSHHARIEPIGRFRLKPRGEKLYYTSSCDEAILANKAAAEIRRLRRQFDALPDQFDRVVAARVWSLSTKLGAAHRIKKMLALGWLIETRLDKGRHHRYSKHG